MGLKIIYPILVIFCTFPHIKVYGKVEESLVRLERIENSDRKIVTLVNSGKASKLNSLIYKHPKITFFI